MKKLSIFNNMEAILNKKPPILSNMKAILNKKLN
jgi:hypothetical protein